MFIQHPLLWGPGASYMVVLQGCSQWCSEDQTQGYLKAKVHPRPLSSLSGPPLPVF